MEPIRQMLLPEERVLYEAHVHPIILVPGAVLLGLAAFLTQFFWNIPAGSGLLIALGKSASLLWVKMLFIKAHLLIVDHPETVRAVILLLMAWSIIVLGKAFCTIFFTNMVITDERIILRQGVYNIRLVEIDRRRVASVMIYQTYLGRMWNYGNVVIQGFAASIYGLPVLDDPRSIQMHIHAKH